MLAAVPVLLVGPALVLWHPQAGSAGRVAGVGASPTRPAYHSAPDPPSVRARHGRRAGSQRPPRRPTSVELPSGVTMRVDVAPADPDGTLRIPADINRAGWWNGSSRLGDPYGAIVVAAHVDSFSQGVGPIAELLGARPGAPIRLSARGRHRSYRIATATLLPRTALADHTADYSSHGRPRLVLITCGGPYSPSTGYRDNLLVTALPAAD